MAWEAHKKPEADSDFSSGSQRACSAHGRRVRHSSLQVAKQLQIMPGCPLLHECISCYIIVTFCLQVVDWLRCSGADAGCSFQSKISLPVHGDVMLS